MLGSGGASQTVQAVLRAQGAEVVVISRRGPVTYGMIEQHADARLVVNATPVGMYPGNGVSPLDLRRVPQCRCVLDLVYNPARTALLQQADRLGLRAENGLSMLAEQARCAAELFLQRPIDPARTAAVTDTLQKRMRSLILIGMPGAGKTTVGRLLAQRLGRDFFDADEELDGASAAISRHFSRARARLPSAQRRRPCWPSWASAPAASSPRAAAASPGWRTSRCCGRTPPSSGCSARSTGCPSPGGP